MSKYLNINFTFLFSLLVIFNSCDLKDIKFEDLKNLKVEGTRFGIPLLDSKVVFENFIEDDYKSKLKVDVNGNYIYRHQEQQESINIEDVILRSLGYTSMEDFFTIDDVQAQEKLDESNLLLSFGSTSPKKLKINFVMDHQSAQDVRVEDGNIAFDLPLSNESNKDSFTLSLLKFKKGKLILELIANSDQTNIEVSLQNVKKNESDPLYQKIIANKIELSDRLRFEIPLENSVFDFWDDKLKKFSSNAPHLIISSNESFKVESFKFSEQHELDQAKIWFKEDYVAKPISFPPQNPGFNLDEAFLGDGNIKIKKIYTSISILNPLNLNLVVHNDLEAKFSDGSVQKNVLDKDTLIEIIPRTSGSISIKNAEDLLQITPTKRLNNFIYSGKVEIVSPNKQYIEAHQELAINTGDKFNIDYIIYFPLEVSFKDLKYEQSFSIDLENSEDYVATNAEFRLFTTTEAPFNMKMKWELNDEDGKLIDTIVFGENGLIMKASTSGKTETSTKFPLKDETVEKLKKTKNTKIIFNLDSDLDGDQEPDFVQLNARDEFTLQGGFIADFDIDFKSF